MKTKLIIASIILLIILGGAGFEANAQSPQLWGMNVEGGVNGDGVLFQYNPSTNIYTKELDFDGATNGSNPNGSLMQACDGNLYGMTYTGGANNEGVLFQYNPSTNIYTKELDFDGTTNGANPTDLMQASDGNLYGMTNDGGANNLGVLFQYNPSTNTYTKELDFDGARIDGATNGSSPYASLMQASNGNLYGMTSAGGANGDGVLFQYNFSTNTYTKLLDFNGTTNGSSPYGSLMQASNGNLYGMTSAGGANGYGVLFQYNPSTNTYTKELDFDGATNGSYPQSSLIQVSNGNLYGMTSNGGANSYGVLFQYNPSTNTYTKELDFDGATNGSYPQGSIMQASNGNLYGMTSAGGANNEGVLFQYNPSTNTYTKMIDFNVAKNGGDSEGVGEYGNLIEIAVTPCVTGITEYSLPTINVYPNPTSGIINLNMGQLQNAQVNIFNVLGESIYQHTIISPIFNIDLSAQPDGVYFIKLITDQGVVNKKVVISK